MQRIYGYNESNTKDIVLLIGATYLHIRKSRQACSLSLYPKLHFVFIGKMFSDLQHKQN